MAYINKTVREKILELREQGRTYQSIADEIGCSKQYVGLVCGKANPNHFQYVREEACIYPNLRKWMNDNKVSRNEIIRLGQDEKMTGSRVHLTEIMKGKSDPPKRIIDRLIKATGMPYEVLFSKVEYSAMNAVPANQYNELLCRYNQLLDAADVFCDIYMNHRRDYSYEMEDD